MGWLRGYLIGLALMLGVSTAMADKRVALVVGNGAYQHADKLANPVLDAQRMRDALGKLGFDVVYGEDLDQRGMQRIIGKFANAVDGADVALVYFAGHGATFSDTPYVVPVDAEFASIGDMPYELVPVETLIGELRRAKGIRIAILDACRDDAAEHDLKRVASRGVGASRGLARVKDPDGLIIAYSTQYLSTAADGDPSADSPFTSAILKHIGTPGLDVKEMFFKVANEVVAETNGKQRPEISISLYDPYSLGDHAGAASNTVHQDDASPQRSVMNVVPPAVLEDRPTRSGSCGREAQSRSVRYDQKTSISFQNSARTRITIYWLNYEGKRVSYGILQPGQTQSIDTFLTHPWLIAKTASDECMAIYMPEPGAKHVVVTGGR